VSKQRFYNASDARQFCKKTKIPLNNSIVGAFLLGATGLAEHHLSEDLKHYSGIWAWSNYKSNNDMVSILFDGHGTDMEEMSVPEINAKFQTDASLPAICTDITKFVFASKAHTVG
jgi:hypothetical protein